MANKRVEDPSEIPTEFMQCRAWREHQIIKADDRVTTNASGRVIEVTKYRMCGRCNREWWTVYSVPDFKPIRGRSKSIYEDGYLVKGGLKPAEAKTEYMHRLGYKLKGEK